MEEGKVETEGRKGREGEKEKKENGRKNEK